MSNKIYNNQYATTNIYGHTVELIKQYSAKDGVHLDVGCGFGAIAELVREEGITYIGMDIETAGLESLSNKNFEVYELDLLNTLEAFEKISVALGERKLSSISILDTLEHLPNAPVVLKMLHKVAENFNCVLIISVPNISHIDVTFKLLLGKFDYTEAGILDHTHVFYYTEETLTKMTNCAGWYQINAYDVLQVQSDQHFPKDNLILHDSCLFTNYLLNFKRSVDKNYYTQQFVRAYLPGNHLSAGFLVNRNELESKVFLSVIVRTQGQRMVTLRDALLCLSAQSNQDFEVFLVAHQINLEQQIELEGLIEELPLYMREKTVLVLAQEEINRGAPINKAIKLARGHYISVLDDDDLVFANWIDNFAKLAVNSYGQVLRAVTVEQNIQIESDASSGFVFKTVGGFVHKYPNEFNLMAHFTYNRTPFMSWSFPRSLFRDFNFSFDESLHVCEDWDLALRAILFCGASSGPAITSIYRKWVKGTSSATDHAQEVWSSDYHKIKAKINSQINLFPGYSINEMLLLNDELNKLRHQIHTGQINANVQIMNQLNDLMSSNSWKITRPLRALGVLARKIKNKLVG